jgi:hypothetical protein
MIPKEKYDLKKMLAEINEDILEQANDFSQTKDIPQHAITQMILDNLKKKKKQPSDSAQENDTSKN